VISNQSECSLITDNCLLFSEQIEGGTMTSTDSSQTAAAVLASFCTAIRWPELPLAVQERTKELLLDHLGVTVRGSAEASSAPVAAFTRKMQSTGPSSVIGAGFCTTPAWAALANGTAAHAIEMDDVTCESSLHPGVAVIPAALAIAEEQGAEVSALLAAIVAGYEVTLRVGNALNPASAYQRGFHPTGVAGVFGATTAAGYLLALDAETLTRALGIAGTMASGSLEYLSDGSWTKRLNAGWAAHAGIVAAGLAQAGFTGPESVFDGPLGLLQGYTDIPSSHRLQEGLGQSFQIMTVAIKPYGCCRYNHGLIDCMLTLKQQYNLQPDDVAAIRLGVLKAGALLVADPIEQKRTPQTIVDAQFSAPFAAAVALIRGAADVNQYTPTNVNDPTIRSLMARTDCYHDPSLEAVYPQQWPAAAKIKLQNGQTVSTQVTYPTGEPENPVSREDLVRKFVMLTDHLLATEAAYDLVRRILEIDYEAGIDGVMRIVKG
jgi:2-methylcitrate dehydratase PrpD